MHRRHEELFGYAMRDRVIEITEVRVVALSAETAAAKVISDQMQPEEAKVTAQLHSFESFLDERKAQYDADLSAFRAELDALKKRNELTRLADRAIGEGSLTEYQRLLRISREQLDPNLQAAGDAEVFRVVSAYGDLSPSRVNAVSINASAESR